MEKSIYNMHNVAKLNVFTIFVSLHSQNIFTISANFILPQSSLSINKYRNLLLLIIILRNTLHFEKLSYFFFRNLIIVTLDCVIINQFIKEH